MENPQPIIKTVITKTGFKPAETNSHELFRLLLIVGIIILVCWSIYKDNKGDKECITLDDISDVIKPGTIMYKSINEMDEETQKKYLRSLKHSLDDDPPLITKFIRGIQVALIAGIASEYAINGNLSKPIGIIGKTIMYNLVYIMATL